MTAPARSIGATGLDVVLALGFALLAALKLEAVLRAGWSVAGASAVIQAAVLAVIFFVRRAPAVGSRDPIDLVLAGGAFVLPLMLSPADDRGPLDVLGLGLQALGGVLALAALIALGPRFGVLPAHRGLCTTGIYAHVRHPMYAAYLLAYLGHALREPTLANVVVVLAAACVLDMRARREEALLSADPGYAAYRARVRWPTIAALR